MERLFALLPWSCSGKKNKKVVVGKGRNQPVVQQQQHCIPEEKENEARDKTVVGQQHYIPEEIVAAILSKLPVKSLLRFKCVCRLWHSLISDPKFDFSTKGRERVMIMIRFKMVGSYEQRSFFYSMEGDRLILLPYIRDSITRSVYDDEVKILGSCNGLLLFGSWPHNSDRGGTVFLWNPTTRCCRKFPLLDDLANRRSDDEPDESLIMRRCAALLNGFTFIPGIIASGLCFDTASNDYKAVVIDASFQVRVACLRKGVICEDISFPYKIGYNANGPLYLIGYKDTRSSLGVLTNGHLHWFVKEKTDGSDLIVYFDEEHNKFNKLPMPDEHVQEDSDTICAIESLQILNGCLCMVRTHTTKSYRICDRDILIMKEFGVKESWTRLYGLQDRLVRLQFSRRRSNGIRSRRRSNDVLYLQCDWTVSPRDAQENELFLTTIKLSPERDPDDDQHFWITHPPFTFVESLTSVHFN